MVSHHIALCLVTRTPVDSWLKFLNTFINYDIYVIYDDNKDYDNKLYSNIKIIKIDNIICMNNGFRHATYRFHRQITAWDKAIYYFSKINTEYEHVWFMEDDVFLYNEAILVQLDSNNTADLIIKSNNMNTGNKNNEWLWSRLYINLPYPWYGSMACMCRVSKKLFDQINIYVKSHNRLMFIEVMFNTLANQNKLTVYNPNELQTIAYRKNWTLNDLNCNQIFHPIKIMTMQTSYREELQKIENPIV